MIHAQCRGDKQNNSDRLYQTVKKTDFSTRCILGKNSI